MGHKPRVDSTRGLALLHANNCNGIRKEEWKESEWDLSHVYLYNLALHSNGSSSDLGVGCDC